MTKMTQRMTQTGFCGYPSPLSHTHCRDSELACTCVCHTDPDAVTEIPAFVAEEEVGEVDDSLLGAGH